MLSDTNTLAACYRRRTLYTTLGAALLGICLLGAPSDSTAQDATPPAAKGAQAKTPDTSKQAKDDFKKPKDDAKPSTKRKPATATLKVVPVPRSRAAGDPQAAPAGGGANPQAGGDPQAGGGARRGRGQGGGNGPGGNGPGGGPGAFGQGGFGQGGFGGFGQRGRRGRGGDTSGLGGLMPGGLGRGGTFQFEFYGADITNVLQLFSRSSGLTITADPGIAGPVTIINNGKSVTLDEAFKILQSILKVRGYTALQNGSVLEIVPIPLGIKDSTIVRPDVDSTTPIDPRDQVMTQIIPLENVDANAMAKDLLPLVGAQASIIGSGGTNSLIVTDNASSIQRIIQIVNALDKASSRTELKVYPLRHAEATNVAQTINDLYKQITPRANENQPQVGGRGFQPIQIPGQAGQQPGINARPAVIAEADNRTNSVLVVASPDNQEQIARDIISRLDDDNSALETEVIKVKYSDAQSVANLVNQVLSNQHSTPQQSTGGGRGGFGGINPFAFGGGNNNSQNTQITPSTDPFGQVTADPRTNSLFVTANGERMARIKDIIKQIDVEVPIETTTFVIPLNNAKAEDVAYALSQAFGTTNSNSSSTNPFAGLIGGGAATTRPGQNGTNSRTGSTSARGGSSNSARSLRPKCAHRATAA